MTDPVLEALKAARALIADPARWTKDAFARAKDVSKASSEARSRAKRTTRRWGTSGRLCE